jgi:hypothetical protein
MRNPSACQTSAADGPQWRPMNIYLRANIACLEASGMPFKKVSTPRIVSPCVRIVIDLLRRFRRRRSVEKLEGAKGGLDLVAGAVFFFVFLKVLPRWLSQFLQSLEVPDFVTSKDRKHLPTSGRWLLLAAGDSLLLDQHHIRNLERLVPAGFRLVSSSAPASSWVTYLIKSIIRSLTTCGASIDSQ